MTRLPRIRAATEGMNRGIPVELESSVVLQCLRTLYNKRIP